MSTSEKLNLALAVLRKRGHVVEANPGAFISPGGELMITIDGQLRTATQIYEMTDETINGSVNVRRETGEERYALSFIPEDYGRGSLGQQYVTEAELLEFIAELRLRESVKGEALECLATQGSCNIPNRRVSRSYLRRMNLVD